MKQSSRQPSVSLPAPPSSLRARDSALGSRLASRQPLLMAVPAVALLLLVGIVPLVFSLALTFHDWTMGKPAGPRFIGLENYRIILFEDGHFWESLLRGFHFTALAVGGEFLLGLGLALLLGREFAGRGVFVTLFLLPMFIAPITVGLIWRFMYNPQVGVINFLLRLVGIQGPVWLGDPDIAMPAVVLVDLWQWTPFMFLILFTGILALPVEVMEAARVDGADGWQRLVFITLPLLKPVILVALALRLIDTLRVFDTIFVLTRGGPADATEVLSLYIYKVGLSFFRMGYATALSYVLLIIITIVVRLLIRRLESADA